MIGILWFLLAIVIIVTVHEYGHYIVGRWSGIKADVFSIGFGPKLFSRTDRHGTRWQVAAIPLGGYVKFKGDADAASAPGDIAGLSPEERRQTMQGAPLWARSATVLAGPFANFLLSFLIFLAVILTLGVASDEVRVGKTSALGTMFQEGDRITALDGQETPDFAAFYEVAATLTAKPEVTYQVERAGESVTLTGPNPLPPLVGEVMQRSAALEAEMQVGDVILRAGGQDIASFDQLPDIVKASEGAPVELTIRRGDQTFDLTMTPRRMDLPKPEGGFETRWLIGLSPAALFEPETRTPGLWEASSLAVTQGITVIRVNLEGIVAMVVGQISTCNLSSPVGMAGAVAAAAELGFERFIQTVAVFSLAIGLLNLFPIPVLDGGHLVFHVYEALTGKPPSDRVMQVLMMAGMSILIGVMLFALSNDLYRC